MHEGESGIGVCRTTVMNQECGDACVCEDREDASGTCGAHTHTGVRSINIQNRGCGKGGSKGEGVDIRRKHARCGIGKREHARIEVDHICRGITKKCRTRDLKVAGCGGRSSYAESSGEVATT